MISHNTVREVSNMYDLSDCDYMDDVVGVYAVDENNELVKVRLGETRRDSDPESENSLYYASSPVFAGQRQVGTINWTDH
jgi:hypothetical protein